MALNFESCALRIGHRKCRDGEARISYVTLSFGESIKVKNINYISEIFQ